MKISVIIPVLNEEDRINDLIARIRAIDNGSLEEIIVADCGPGLKTLKAVRDSETVLAGSPKGRGRQMNAGADIAGGDILLFLHADTDLPDNAFEGIVKVFENGKEKYAGGAFDLSFDNDSKPLKVIAAVASVRSRLTRIPYGDQAVFISKIAFRNLRGFKDIPLMEDVEFMRRLGKHRLKIKILRDRVVTSARKWENNGIVKTTLTNWLIMILYLLGIKPDKLAEIYYGGHEFDGCGQKNL